MRSDADRVNDILDAIAKINARITVSFEEFQNDEMLLKVRVRHIRSEIRPPDSTRQATTGQKLRQTSQIEPRMNTDGHGWSKLSVFIRG